jgi:hypothetical protein
MRRSITYDEASILFYCNLGLLALIDIGDVNRYSVCFCPPSFFGYKCEFNSDRITIITHLNLTNSSYSSVTDNNLILKVRGTLLFDDKRILDTYEFHVRPVLEQTETNPVKHRFYLLYSRTNESLAQKRARYLNRSDIILQHPYSVQFELFELLPNKDVQVVAHWYFHIYFDFLPAFRLAKVLNISAIDRINGQCSCNNNSTCIPVLNTNTKKCICKSGRYGRFCELVDSQCTSYCNPEAFCQPNNPPYNRPTCICPYDMFGPRCFLRYRICETNPCENNGFCFHTYDPSGINSFQCKCSDRFYGKTCALEKSSIRLYLNVSYEFSKLMASTVQYYDTDVVTLELKLRHQQVEQALPLDWYYLHGETVAPMFGVLKVYERSDNSYQYRLFLLYLQPNVSIINITTQVSLYNLCPLAHALLNISK